MSTKLYIGNLPFAVSEDELADHMAAAGQVVSTKIIMDRATNRSKGFGFVEMSSAEEAQEAISRLDGSELLGRNIRVSIAREKSEGDRFDRRPSRGDREDFGDRRGGFRR